MIALVIISVIIAGIIFAVIAGLIAAYGGKEVHVKKEEGPAVKAADPTPVKKVEVVTSTKFSTGMVWSVIKTALKAMIVVALGLMFIVLCLWAIDSILETKWIEELKKWFASNEGDNTNHEVPQTGNWLGVVPIQVWVFIAIILAFAIVFTKGRTRGIAGALAAVLVALVAAFGLPGLWTKAATTVDRCANQGVCSNPTPPVVNQPVRYQNGMFLNLLPGERRTIILAQGATIKVQNYERGHCMYFAPKSKVKREWNSGHTEAEVSMYDGQERVLIVGKLRPGQSVRQEEGDTDLTCPPRRN